MEGIEAFMGSRVHEVLEKLYVDKRHSVDDSLDYLLDLYETLWEQNWHDDVVVVKKEYTAENYKEMGRKAIIDYYERYAPFDQGKVVGIEEKVTIPLGEGTKDTFIGVLDRLMLMPDGIYEIHDYKTSGRLPKQSQVDSDEQLALYQLAVETSWPDAMGRVRLVWHYLLFDKELHSERDRERLEALVKDVRKRIDIINATTEFPTKESMLCNWCGYRDMCPAKGHQAKVAALSSNEFAKDDGVRLVDQYVEVDDAIKELTEKKAQLQEAIHQFAERGGFRTLVGSGHKLRISKYETVTFPTKKGDGEAYQRLVSTLKEEGVWDEVSELDKAALKDRLASGEWPSGLEEAVERYRKVTEQRRINRSKIKGDE